MNPLLRRIIPRQCVEVCRNIVGPVLRSPRLLERLQREEFFQRAFNTLTFNGIAGDYVEFGCHGGVTFYLAYRESRRLGLAGKLWAFDSFQGLPPQRSAADAHPEWVAGAMTTSLDQFHQLCRRNGIPRQDYEVVPGFYEESLAHYGADTPPTNISLAYIDCDLYSSTRTVLQFVVPRFKHGMILAFDDYYNYSATQLSGERRACLELLQQHPRWVLAPYQPIGWFGMSFIVESRALHQSLPRANGPLLP